MSKELEYFQEIIKVDEEMLKLANKEKNKKQDIMLHRHWLNERKNSIEKALKEKEELARALSIATCENGDLLKYKKAFDVIKKNALYVDWDWLFTCVVHDMTYESYEDGCKATKETTYADKEEFDLLKEAML